MPRKWLILGVVVLGLWMDVMDMTIVNVAIPAIQSDLHATLQGVQYILTAYMITIGIFEPLTAYLADTMGIKRIYLVGILIFTLASVADGLSWNLPTLIAFRILQGVGGGVIMPLAMGIVTLSFAPEERALAMGLMGLPLIVAPAVAPTLGGWFVQFHSWRDVFWINVPVGIAAFASAQAVLPRFPVTKKTFDWVGFLLAGIGFAGLLAAVSEGPSQGWGSLLVVELLIGSIFALALFVLVEARVSTPLFDLRIMRISFYTNATIVVFFTMMSLFGVLYLLPVFLQEVGGLGPMDSGMVLIPLVLSAGAGIVVSSALQQRGVGAPLLTFAGLLVMGLGTMHFALLGTSWNDGWLRLWISITGAGLGLGIMPPVTVAYSSLPNHWMNQGSSMLSLIRQVGSAFGVAVLTTVLQNQGPRYWAQLAATVTPTSAPAIQFLSGCRERAMELGVSASGAHLTALAMLARTLQTVATERAFHDAFMVTAVLAFVGIFPGFLLLGSRRVFRRTPQENDEAQ